MRRLYGWILVGFLPIVAGASGQTGVEVTSASAAPPDGQLALGQELPSEAASIEGLIRLDVVVSDQAGHAIEGLKRGDFKVSENGVVQSLVAFRKSNAAASGSDDGLSVILLLDTLDLPGSLEQQAREHAVEFVRDLAQQERVQTADSLRRNGSKLAHPVTIYSLEKSGFYLTAGPSLNGESLAQAISADEKAQTYFVPPSDLCKPNGNLFPLVPAMVGLRALGTIATQEVSRPGRKLLLWIGPGLKPGGTGAFTADGQGLLTKSPPCDNHRSPAPIEFHLQGPDGQKNRTDLYTRILWFSALLRQARVTLDTLAETGVEESPSEWDRFVSGAADLQSANWMDLYKKVLAIQSGGRALPFAEDRVRQIDDAIEAERNAYSLTFEPLPVRGEEYHSLKVEVNGANLTARTITGYYDEPYYEDLPDPAVEHVTLAQLQTMILKLGYRKVGQRFVDLAMNKQQLPRPFQHLELTERVSPIALEQYLRLSGWHDDVHALDELADQSSFLAPPPSEILADPAPDQTERERILSAASDYLHSAAAELPDVFANRTAVFYRGSPPLQTSQTKNTVVYRHGDELLVDDKMQSAPGGNQALNSYGTFGPILNSLQVFFSDRSGFTWKRWEKSASGPLAVFAYETTGTPKVMLSGCCFPNDRIGRMEISAPSHVEIVIDPRSGAILRIQVEDILGKFVPNKRSDLVVSYGPVVIQGKTLIVPLHSVTIWRGRTVLMAPAIWEKLTFSSWGPYETRMSVFTFDNYHNFRSEAHILPN